MGKVLIIDDDVTFTLMLSGYLTRHGFEVASASSFSDGMKFIQSGNFQVALLDVRLPDRNGLELLSEIRSLPKKCHVVVMTGYGDIPTAVKAIKSGASDYVTKPLNPEEILHLVTQLCTSEARAPEPAMMEYVNGTSAVSRTMNDYMALVAPTDMSVLILGESGTGKEFVARKIHGSSKRSSGPFVAMDCGALPRDLAASEFFGHVKGAFTGAIADKTGHFVEANGGTLFLDEIGNLSYEVQMHLLRAIQERQIRPVGSNKMIEADVRIITATNEDLRDAVQKGNFREDLYHRLNEFSIHVPRLSQREEDLFIFAETFLHQANRELNRSVETFSPEVIDTFRKYPWPGNIRELKNVVKRAVLLSHGHLITLDTLPHEITENLNNNASTGLQTDDLKELKDKVEYQRIIAVLEKVRYNKSKAAQLLNIDRKTLYNKLKQYNIEN